MTSAGIAVSTGSSHSHARYGAALATNMRQTTTIVPATTRLVIAQAGQISRKRPMARRRRSRFRTAGIVEGTLSIYEACAAADYLKDVRGEARGFRASFLAIANRSASLSRRRMAAGTSPAWLLNPIRQ